MKNTCIVKFLVMLVFISVVLFACSNHTNDEQPLLPQSSDDTSVSSIETTESLSIAVKNQDEPLTLNGEKLGHEGLAAWISKITEVGIQVLVIPGNHDINNPFAREIKDGQFYKADYVSPMEFEEIYAPYGYADPAYRDTNSLSYISIFNDNLYAVTLDICTYETNVKQNISVTSGAVRTETLEWIESSVKAIKQQKPQAHFITVLFNHLLMYHRFFNNNFVLKILRKSAKNLQS